jgi:Na+-translocating ferredoxin:NAD+ oxidoreductase RnfG subunit
LRSSLRALALLFALGAAAGGAEAKVYLSQREALEAAFPDADAIDKTTHVLDDAQAERVQALAQARLDSRLVTLHTATRGGVVLGHALIEVHTVRTLPEAVLVVLSPDGHVQSLRMLAFYEPEEYLPSQRWLAQFDGSQLGQELRLQGKIHGIAGSTLSSRAVTSGVRRALALYEVLLREPAGTPAARAPAAGGAGAVAR